MVADRGEWGPSRRQIQHGLPCRSGLLFSRGITGQPAQMRCGAVASSIAKLSASSYNKHINIQFRPILAGFELIIVTQLGGTP